MKKLNIQAEISIHAEAETVWKVLLDFDSYAEWNPFIRQISGIAQPGNILHVKICPPGAKPMFFKPRITVLENKARFAWLGKLYIKGLFDGEHHFEIHQQENGSIRFLQFEQFSGILVPLFKNSLLNNTKLGFDAMNEALKLRCEAQARFNV